MPVRKTESKLPFTLTADDLGQNQSASDGKSVLISFLSSPVVTNRLQQYVVFVTDTGQAGNVHEFKWNFDNAGNGSTQTSINGYAEYTPAVTGSLAVQVELRNNSGGVISTLTLQQEVVVPNPELEALINASGSSLPVAGNPNTSREVINDLRVFIDELAARNTDPDATENSLLFSLAYHEVLQQTATQRAPLLERIANALHQDDKTELKDQARNGIGVCHIKPQVLAMFQNTGTSTVLPFTPLPSTEAQQTAARTQLIDDMEALSVDVLINLFNSIRFPKANLAMCKKILDGLKTRYYAGNTYVQLVQNRNNCLELINHFKNGPIGTPP